MNRRDFIRSTAALGVASLLPTWTAAPPKGSTIDLRPFCDAHGALSWKFKMSEPFVQEMPTGELSRFGTDGRICIRTGAKPLDLAIEIEKLPPAAGLNWNHANVNAGQWRPLPTDEIIAADVTCPRCNGTGVWPDLGVCVNCGGDGDSCWVCHHESGRKGPPCATCKGYGDGVFPGLTLLPNPVGAIYIDAKFRRLVTKHLGRAEYWMPTTHEEALIKNSVTVLKPIMLRGDGWTGLLSNVGTDCAVRAIDKAKVNP